jgi:hypothetical protein
MPSLFYLFAQQHFRRRRHRNKSRPFPNNLRPLLPRDQDQMSSLSYLFAQQRSRLLVHFATISACISRRCTPMPRLLLGGRRHVYAWCPTAPLVCFLSFNSPRSRTTLKHGMCRLRQHQRARASEDGGARRPSVPTDACSAPSCTSRSSSDWRDDTLHFWDICYNSVPKQFTSAYDGMGLPTLIIANKNV